MYMQIVSPVRLKDKFDYIIIVSPRAYREIFPVQIFNFIVKMYVPRFVCEMPYSIFNGSVSIDIIHESVKPSI